MRTAPYLLQFRAVCVERTTADGASYEPRALRVPSNLAIVVGDQTQGELYIVPIMDSEWDPAMVVRQALAMSGWVVDMLHDEWRPGIVIQENRLIFTSGVVHRPTRKEGEYA
jgi:hypothetical protein